MPAHFENNSIPVKTDENCFVRSNDEAHAGTDKRRVLVPTLQASSELQYAYNYFNDTFWGGRLVQPILTYTRRKNCYGYFAPDRFQSVDGSIVPEIALNAAYLAARHDRESLATLVHEMVHSWRHYFGPLNSKGGRGRNGYHDKVWGAEMRRVGLIPSDTGLPGGNETGYRVSHYIEDGGPFDEACAALLKTGFQISWSDKIVRNNSSTGTEPNPPEAPKKKDRIKFSCIQPGCGLNAWAKSSARLLCGSCHAPMHAANLVAGVLS